MFARQRERIDELKLVVEVVLEPEHDLDAAGERLDELPVAPLEHRQQRTPPAPAAVGQERARVRSSSAPPTSGTGPA